MSIYKLRFPETGNEYCNYKFFTNKEKEKIFEENNVVFKDCHELRDIVGTRYFTGKDYKVKAVLYHDVENRKVTKTLLRTIFGMDITDKEAELLIYGQRRKFFESILNRSPYTAEEMMSKFFELDDIKDIEAEYFYSKHGPNEFKEGYVSPADEYVDNAGSIVFREVDRDNEAAENLMLNYKPNPFIRECNTRDIFSPMSIMEDPSVNFPPFKITGEGMF